MTAILCFDMARGSSGRRARRKYTRRMADTHELTQAAYDRLKAEYDDLTTRGRVDIARKIEAARELGDLSENGDYHAAKEEQGKMEGRIVHLHALIENHVTVHPPDSAAVRVGDRKPAG